MNQQPTTLNGWRSYLAATNTNATEHLQERFAILYAACESLPFLLSPCETGTTLLASGIASTLTDVKIAIELAQEERRDLLRQLERTNRHQ